MSIFLKRDTKLYLRKTVGAQSAIWEIPVLDGFSFSQGNTTSEVILSEMEDSLGASKRGRRAFNDALAPAEWSFSTYIRPFRSTIAYSSLATDGTGAGAGNNHFAIEEQLWANFVGNGTWITQAGGIATTTVTSSLGDTYRIDSTNSTQTGGTGAVFSVLIGINATVATVTLVNGGTGFVNTNTITIPGSSLGGRGGNLTLTVTGVSGGAITTFSQTTVTALPLVGPQVFEIDRGEYSTAGGGSGATFSISLANTTGAPTVTTINPGSGYTATTSIITVPASALGKTGGSVVITVATISTASPNYDSQAENFTRDTTDLNISFAGSGIAELGTFDLFFVMGATNSTTRNYSALDDTIEIYRLANCVVNEATVNFDVDGIATIDWSGNATSLRTETAGFNASAAITEGINSTANFIRNKLTSLSLTSNPGVTRTAFPGAGAGVYNITLTGGSITFSNNITFLTPETLGIVNNPIGHITGNKSITGNFTAYVDAGTAGDSGSLFDAATNARSIITNSFSLRFNVGGTTTAPRFEIFLPTTHLEIPTIQTEDVIAVDIAFSGLPATITSNDEATLTYIGA